MVKQIITDAIDKRMRRVQVPSREVNVSSLVLVQELCESRGGRPGLSVLTNLLVSVDVKLY